MRIAILTFHRAYNCGAMLQAWALKTVLERMGHKVEFPVCNHVGERNRWPKPWLGPFRPGLRWGVDLFRSWRDNFYSIPNEGILIKRYKHFRETYLPECNVHPANLAGNYDLIILGSDQIWHPVISRPDTDFFLGETLSDGIRKISYAASYGDQPLSTLDLQRVVALVDRLNAVSVRESAAREQLKSIVKKDVFLAADPTLLLSADDYDEIANGRIPDEPYLFMYTLSTDGFLVDTARKLARQLDVECVIAPCYQRSRYGAPRGLTYGVSPDRLVQFARNAKYVLSCSFHGTVMGVLFKKPFLSLRRTVDQYESRPASLLRRLGCEDRLVNPSNSENDMLQRLIAPLPDFQNKVTQMRQESLAWLRSAVEG